MHAQDKYVANIETVRFLKQTLRDTYQLEQPQIKNITEDCHRVLYGQSGPTRISESNP